MNKKQKQLRAAVVIANRHPDLHPWQVALAACNGEDGADFDAFLVGLLHDSIEDGYSTPEELSFFPDDVVTAVIAVTRKDGERYWDYIARVKDSSALARKVKLADARMNLKRCQTSFGYSGLEKRYRGVIEELGE